jgi:hypothetical protein
MPAEAATTHAQEPPSEPEWLELVRAKVRDLRYGVVHDGRVTQIERTERTRLPSEREERAPR